MDTYEGRNGEPMTLHKYLYTHGNPVSYVDPSGNFSLGSLSVAVVATGTLASVSLHVGFNFEDDDDFFDVADSAIEGFIKHLDCLGTGSRPGSQSAILGEEFLTLAAAISPYALYLKSLFKVTLPKWFRPLVKFGDGARWSQTSSLLRVASLTAKRIFGTRSILGLGLGDISNALKARSGVSSFRNAQLLLRGTARVGAVGLMAAAIIRTADCGIQQFRNPF